MVYGMKTECDWATILLVEDDPEHARLITKNLRRFGVCSEILALDNGQKAVGFLFNPEESAQSRDLSSLLVLLDLNMPVLDGYQVLQRIKGDERTRTIPVVVLTTTDNPAEIERCYRLGCNMYVTKPIEYDDFSRTIGNLTKLLSMVKIPQYN